MLSQSMNREPHYLFDMLDAIQMLQRYTSEKTKQNLAEDIRLMPINLSYFRVIRNLLTATI